MKQQPIRLISWNVAGRVAKQAAQADHLSALSPDIVALQEITRRTQEQWHGILESQLGLPHLADSFESAHDLSVLTGPRKYGQLFASRFPLRSLPPTDFPVPWPERVLSAVIDSPAGPIEAHTTHIPPGATNEWIKIETLEGIARRLGRPHEGHRFLCGDFNLPQLEPLDEQTIYWDMQRRPDGSYRRRRKPRWGEGERGVHEGLATNDLCDAYRALHGRVDSDAYSWIPNHGKEPIPRRFDHLYASRSLGVIRCEYQHAPRLENLSDHSLVLAEFCPDRTLQCGLKA
ncbi:MAG: hypothetical protein EA376_13790 [Phycisphaeraceae bacterium]|nr:MAG: hypothetical protein EA376_13790 [Phycisphaeraceae bacterium]